jgi:uncharacterized protein DUF3303
VSTYETDDALAFAKWAQEWSDLISYQGFPAIDD